jgi:hypothetical protein
MAIQFSGVTPINITFSSTGARSQLLTQFQNQLTTAGWSVISGGGTGNLVMESATTPQGIKIRVNAIDPGSGNCVQFKITDNTTLVGPVTMFLLPVNGSLFRLWANPYQFFYFLSGTDMSKPRSFVCGGVPWIPFFVQNIITTPYAGWLHGNGSTDTDTMDLGASLRTRFTADRLKNYSAIWNGVTFGVAGTFSVFGLLVQTALTPIDDIWEDGTFTLFETVLVWESVSFPTPVRHGLLWDACMTTKALDSELRRTFGNATWMNITHDNGISGAIGRGCLMLCVAPPP